MTRGVLAAAVGLGLAGMVAEAGFANTSDRLDPRKVIEQSEQAIGRAIGNYKLTDSTGAPLSLRQYVKERGIDFRVLDQAARFTEVERLAKVLMEKVGSVVPVLPVALVTTALLDAGTPLSMLELKAGVLDLAKRLARAGAHVHIPRGDQDYAIEVGLRMLRLRHLVAERDGLYGAEPDETPLLRYYANSIVHLLAVPA